jgi:phosphatidylinositol glycan class B
MTDEAPRLKPWMVSLAVASVASLVAVIQLGRLHPDEVYQFLEPAWWRVHNYGIKAWEWEVGIRNWAVPLFFSVIIRFCDAVGIHHPRVVRALIEVPQFLLHAWMLQAVYRYAERRVGARWGLWAIFGVGLYGLVIAFAGRTLGESISASFFIIGAEALDRTERPVRAGLIGGALLGLSVVARYGSAALVVAAMIWLLGARKWKVFGLAALSGLAVAAGLGLLDLLTWHRAFHSFIYYFEFNVTSGQAALHFGRQPASFYVSFLFEYAPLWVWPGLVFAVWKQRPRIPITFFCAVAYLVVLSVTAHKELRFLYPGWVCLAVAAAPGVVGLLRLIPRPDLRASLAPVAVAIGLGVAFIPGELQAQRGDQFRAIIEATRPPEVTGLLIVNEGVWGAGGSFYIGKPIPWLNADQPSEYGFQVAMRDKRINRVITYDERALSTLQEIGFKIIDRIDRATILAR